MGCKLLFMASFGTFFFLYAFCVSYGQICEKPKILVCFISTAGTLVDRIEATKFKNVFLFLQSVVEHSFYAFYYFPPPSCIVSEA